jgi:hypothetical protein
VIIIVMIDGQVLARWKIKDQFKKEHGKLFSGPRKTQTGLESVARRLKVRSSVSLVASGCSSACHFRCPDYLCFSSLLPLSEANAPGEERNSAGNKSSTFYHINQ